MFGHTGTCVHPRPSRPGYWSISFLFLVGPGPLHEIAVSAFSRSLLGHANAFSFQYLPSTLHICFKCFSSFTLFLSASLSLPAKLLYGQYLLINPSMFSRPRYPILFQLALSLFSPIQPYQLWLATSFLAYSLPHTPLSTFSRLSLFYVGTFLVMLLILHYYASYRGGIKVLHMYV